MSGLAFLDAVLDDLRARHLLREPRVLLDTEHSFCANDYFALSHAPLSPDLAAASGSGASPLVTGFRAEHLAAQRAVADWFGTEDALLFSSGYAANLGTIAALVGPEDLILSDALNHASIIDGCRLSKATVVVYPHLDLAAVKLALADRAKYRRCLIVTESYFSMDADTPDLVGLRALADEHDAILMVDEAHAIGVYGPEGAGLCAARSVVPDVFVGTLGKALGLSGAFVAGTSKLTLFLWNAARSFVFSTGSSPAIASLVPARITWLRAADSERARLLANADRLRELCTSLPVLGYGPVVPISVATPRLGLDVSERLRTRGWVVQTIRPPTVRTPRLRVTLSADLEGPAVEALARAFIDALR